MKKIPVFVSIILSLMSLVCLARNAQELFLRANKCYESNEWRKALDAYDAINRKGHAVWYNMGNCLYHLHQYPDALVCFKRAQKGATNGESRDIVHNVQAVMCKLGKEEKSTWWEKWYAFMQSGAALFPLLALQLIFLLAWYLLFFCARWCIKNWWYLASSTFLSVAVLLASMGLLVTYQIQRYPIAIVLKEQASLFAGPNQDYHVLDTAQCADEVKIYTKQPGWYKVAYHGTLGWVAADDVKVV